MDSQTTIATVEGVRALEASPPEAQHDPLLVLALQNQVPVETIERLVALKERQEERSARQRFIEAMARFRSTCPNVAKSSTAKITTRGGSGYEFRYAELDEIADTIRPHAEANGLAYTWSCRFDAQAQLLTTVCKLQHIGGHEESAEFPVPTASSSAMSDQQRFAAAFTFGRRQSLFAVFGLATTDETPDKPGDVQPITEEQAATVAAMLDELPEPRRAAFYKWVGFANVEQIPANRYGEVVAALEKARGAS